MKWNRANCMGYAFKKNRWLFPQGWRETDANQMAELMCERFGVKRIKRSDMVDGKEYIVFRLGDGDFHFARRSADGHWRHKPGASRVRSINEREVFGCMMSGRYCSTPIVFEV